MPQVVAAVVAAGATVVASENAAEAQRNAAGQAAAATRQASSDSLQASREAIQYEREARTAEVQDLTRAGLAFEEFARPISIEELGLSEELRDLLGGNKSTLGALNEFSQQVGDFGFATALAVGSNVISKNLSASGLFGSGENIAQQGLLAAQASGQLSQRLQDLGTGRAALIARGAQLTAGPGGRLVALNSATLNPLEENKAKLN